MAKTVAITVRVADAPAFKDFVRDVLDVRDHCLGYDEAQGNYGDIERIGEHLDEALDRFREASTPPTEMSEP